ncbi:MAG: hypothetical protein ACXABY_05920 [Candidatus Thorarchaeota archaeon]|jgi:hypothetical protein
MKYFKFLWFLVWFTPYAIVGGVYLAVAMWWDDVECEYRRMKESDES